MVQARVATGDSDMVIVHAASEIDIEGEDNNALHLAGVTFMALDPADDCGLVFIDRCGITGTRIFAAMSVSPVVSRTGDEGGRAEFSAPDEVERVTSKGAALCESCARGISFETTSLLFYRYFYLRMASKPPLNTASMAPQIAPISDDLHNPPDRISIRPVCANESVKAPDSR